MPWSRSSRKGRRWTARSSTRSLHARNRRPRPQARPRRSSIAALIVAGGGNLGRSLVQAFKAAGRQAQLVRARGGLSRLAQSRGEFILFLAVPDGVVSSYAAELARVPIPRRASVVHVSGTLGLEALDQLRPGHPRRSVHPLQSFPAPRTPDAFQGITVAVDASTPSLRRKLLKLARDIGAPPRHADDRQRALH